MSHMEKKTSKEREHGLMKDFYQGYQKGLRQKTIDIARRLLQAGINQQLILGVTELPEIQLQQLQLQEAWLFGR